MNATTAGKHIRGTNRPGIDIPGDISFTGHAKPLHAACLACLACMMLAGCTAMTNSTTASEAGTVATTAAGMEPRSGAQNSATRPDGTMRYLRGVVQQIEWIPEQQADIAVSGAMGAAAIGGSVPGAGSPAGFRVTLRTDDGSLQSVMVGMQPECNVGDHVTYSDGVVAR